MSIAERGVVPVAIGAIVASTLTLAAPTRAIEPAGVWGTATIDGTLGDSEWPWAVTGFTAELPPHDGAGSAAVTVWVMNDATNLYVAVAVGRPAGHLSIAIDFDEDDDGTTEVGEEHLFVETPNGHAVDAQDRHRTTCPGDPPGSAGCTTLDTSAGGSDDLDAAVDTTAEETIIELAQPLSSGDGLDLALEPEDPVGFRIVLTLENISPGCSGATCTTETTNPTTGFERVGVEPILRTDLSTNPATPELGWYGDPVDVTLTATYHGLLSTPVTMTYSATGAQPIAETSAVTRQRTFTVSNEGTTTVAYRSSVSGYVEPEKTATIRIDDTPPVPGFVRLAGGAAFTKQVPIPLQWSATDAPSGLRPSVAFRTTGGSHGVIISAVDHAAGTANVYPFITPGTPAQLETNVGVTVVWTDLAGNTAEMTDSIVYDTAPPSSGSVLIDGGATATGDLDVVLTLTATDLGTGVQQMRLATVADPAPAFAPPSTYTTMPYQASLPYTLPAGSEAAVWVSFGDGADNWSAWTYATIAIDLVAPVVGFPARPLHFDTAFGTNRPRVRINWTSSESAQFTVQRSADGGAYVAVGAPTFAHSVTEGLAPGHRYRYRVRGVDGVGRISAWAYSPAFRVSGHQESSRSIRYGGTWTTVSDPDAWGDELRRTRTRGASASLSFTGRSVAWVARRGPTSGRAQVYVDGRFVKTVDLRSATRIDRAVVYQRTWSTVGSHTIRIVNLGTPGRPRIVLDGFGVIG